MQLGDDDRRALALRIGRRGWMHMAVGCAAHGSGRALRVVLNAQRTRCTICAAQARTQVVCCRTLHRPRPAQLLRRARIGGCPKARGRKSWRPYIQLLARQAGRRQLNVRRLRDSCVDIEDDSQSVPRNLLFVVRQTRFEPRVWRAWCTCCFFLLRYTTPDRSACSPAMGGSPDARAAAAAHAADTHGAASGAGASACGLVREAALFGEHFGLCAPPLTRHAARRTPSWRPP
jgi:hypothetical protein